MFSLEQVEQDLVSAMKAKNQVEVDTLRGLKTRIQNAKVAKMKDLTEPEMLDLVKSEVKRRKEAAAAFTSGQRTELAAKEQQEAGILEKYLPPQLSEEAISELVNKVITENNFTAADFGKAMGLLKAQAGQSADGAVLAKLLKEKLK